MLKIIPKYLIKEHIGPFFFALLAINLTFILNIVFRDFGKFVSKGLPITVIFEFLFLNLAWMIALSVPMAVLTATLMAHGRLTADNEFTAIRSSGIGFQQLLPSVLLTAALLGAFLIWFNNEVLPDFNHRARMLAWDINKKKPTLNLDSGVFYTDIPNYSILVQKIDEENEISKIENITIYDQTDPNNIITVVARHGELQMEQNTGFLKFSLFDGEIQELNILDLESIKRVRFPKHILKIPVQDMLLRRSESGFRGDREKSAGALMQDVEKNNENIRKRLQKIREKVTKHFEKYLYATNRSASKEDVVENHKRFLRQIKAEVKMAEAFRGQNNIYLVEVHKKYSIPVACVIFILIGAPLGVMMKRGGMLVSAGVSFVFFLLYWICLIGGEHLADREIITPVMAMWSPNFLVGLGGIVLCYKMFKT